MTKEIENLKLVPVTMKDMDLLFEWANDSECRKNAFNSNRIEYIEHKNWFLEKTNDDNCKMYFYVSNNEYIGQVRVEFIETTGLISYSIKKEFRGRGHGIKMLRLLEEKIHTFENTKFSCLVGKVKINNIASQKVFEKLGYIAVKKVGYILYTKYYF